MGLNLFSFQGDWNVRDGSNENNNKHNAQLFVTLSTEMNVIENLISRRIGRYSKLNLPNMTDS